MTAPSVGRIVLAVGFRATMNGTDTAPALLTRTWGDAGPDGAFTVNATVFPDTGSAVCITSAKLWPDEEAARASLQHGTMTALYWPPRV
jgi:hypothetical protein